MGTTLNRQAFQRLVDEDVEWLMKQPRTLEREHVAEIVKATPEVYYGLIDWAQSQGQSHHNLAVSNPNLTGTHNALSSAYFELAKELRTRLHGPGGT